MNGYVFDGYVADTEPGNTGSPFSPPLDWQGDDAQFIAWLRGEFERSPQIRQRMALLSRDNAKGVGITYTGPHAQALAQAVAHFGRREPVTT